MGTWNIRRINGQERRRKRDDDDDAWMYLERVNLIILLVTEIKIKRKQQKRVVWSEMRECWSVEE